ncbi:MAG: PEGA domain-containing protein [Acidobacteria bacterium]|nr:PEGA domain-containing protein [Acidobacteriota bacterium]
MDTAIARAPRSHPVSFEDGLGKRYHLPGPGGEKLEVLAFSDSLTAASSFEFSIRERVGALAAFQHPAFARVRGVQRLGQDTAALALVSECAPGARLSDVLSVAEQQLLPLDINAALHLIRQLVQAVAALHEQLHGISHGSIAPERLVVASHGRLVVVEHALGAALEQLHFTHERYWKEFGIPLPNPMGTPRFDQRADILQVGAVALALIVGRPLYSEEFPDRIGPLAERAWGLTAAGGVEPLPAAVRTWLARALQLDARQSFPSAVEACAELDRIMGTGDQVAAVAAVRAFLAQYAKHAPLASAPAEPAPSTPAASGASRSKAVPVAMPVVAAEPRPAAAAVAVSPSATPPAPPAATPVPPPVAPARAAAAPVPPVRPPQPAPAEREREKEERTDSAPGEAPWWRRRWIAAVVVLGVLASAGGFAGRWYVTPPAAAEATGTLIVDSNPPGAAAIVDREPRGFTPLTIALSPGAHVLEVVNGAERRTIPLTIAAGNTVSQFLDLPTAVQPTTGELQVRTDPPGARVTVDGVARGQTPVTVEDLQPGAHTVVLANDLISVTQEVAVEAGATASLVVPMTTPQGVPVSGWIAVAAPVDVQVYERERLLGSSRSDRIMVAVGRHELDLVNEALGFRATRVVNVAPGQVAPIRLEWPNGSVALNAQPWAEVWIDGERVGETPIGNVAVPIGPHEVVFRHPELGEQVVRTTVTLTAPARLSVDLRKR